MNSTLIIIFLIFICFLLLAVFFYNRLVKYNQLREEALSGIDVQLKRRADIVPKLVNLVKTYARHENSVFEKVTKLRAFAKDQDISDLKRREAAEQEMSLGLGRVLLVAENYPDLKAHENFQELMVSLVDIEDNIQMARRYYNGTVRNLNILVESFPSNIVARLFKFTTKDFFELESLTDRLPPEINLVCAVNKTGEV